MKFNRILVALIALLTLTLACAVRAQTNTAPTVPGIATTFGQWFTSENTNLYFQDATFWDGPINNTVATANEVGAGLDLWRGTGNSISNHTGGLFLDAEARTRNASVAGTFVSQSLGASFGYCQNDVKVGVYGDALYRFTTGFWGGDTSRFAGEFGVQGSKLLTANTGVTLFAGYQTGLKDMIFGGQLSLSFGNGTGFLGMF